MVFFVILPPLLIISMIVITLYVLSRYQEVARLRREISSLILDCKCNNIIPCPSLQQEGSKGESDDECNRLIGNLAKKLGVDEGSLKKYFKDLFTVEENDLTVYLKEYELSQEMVRHYDTLNWTIGSIFLVGISSVMLVFRGQSYLPKNPVSILTPIAGSALVSAWILWFARHKSIYDIKNDRIHAIEKKLKMAQHISVGRANRLKLLATPSGFLLAEYLSLLTMLILLALSIIITAGN